MGRFFGLLLAVFAAGCLGDYTQTTYGESRARNDVADAMPADTDDVSDALVVPDGEADVFTPTDAALDVAEAGEDALDADASDAGNDVGADVITTDAFDAGTPDVVFDASSDARDASVDLGVDAGSDAGADVLTDTGVDSGPRTITLEPVAYGTLFGIDPSWVNARAASMANSVNGLVTRVAGYRSSVTNEFVIERLIVRFAPVSSDCSVYSARLELALQFSSAPLFAHFFVLPSRTGVVVEPEYNEAQWMSSQLGPPLSSHDPFEGTPRPSAYRYAIELRDTDVADWRAPIVFGARSGQDVRNAQPSMGTSGEEELAFQPGSFRLTVNCR